MAYPQSFHRIVAIGTLAGTEQFNFGLNVIKTDAGILPAEEEMLPLLAPIFSAWFALGQPTGPGIMENAILTSLKVNGIGTDGKYLRPDSFEHVYTSGIPGPQTGLVPSQLSHAVSLRTAVGRGLASKGRFYLPPTWSTVQTQADGRVTTTVAASLATAAKNLIANINTAYAGAQTGDEAVMRVGVTSNVRTGAQHAVTRVQVGRVVDTIRSRRTSLDEDPQGVAVP